MKTYKEILTPKVMINSIIAGALVLFGALSTGNLTLAGIGFAIAGAGIAFCTQLKEEIKPLNKKGDMKLFSFY